MAHVYVHEEGYLMSSVVIRNVRRISSTSGDILHTTWNQVLTVRYKVLHRM